MNEQKFTHINDKGEASMVDISTKTPQRRSAEAEGFIQLQAATLKLISDNQLKKGDVISTARIAGIQGAKQTALLIPLCHQLLTEKISVNFNMEEKGLRVKTFVRCTGKTGIEIEAITAASIALLTVYDMCKAVDKTMIIGDIKLTSKIKEDIA